MARRPDQERRRHERYARTTDAGMVNGRVEATTEARGKIWEEWRSHCESYRVSPYLDECDFDQLARVALNFCGKIRHGKGQESQSVLAVWEPELKALPHKSVWTEAQDPSTNSTTTS